MRGGGTGAGDKGHFVCLKFLFNSASHGGKVDLIHVSLNLNPAQLHSSEQGMAVPVHCEPMAGHTRYR